MKFTLFALQKYASLHPVYARCAKKVDMASFTKVIAKTCGNIHEKNAGCAKPCEEAMKSHAAKFGCCWETVMMVSTRNLSFVAVCRAGECSTHCAIKTNDTHVHPYICVEIFIADRQWMFI